MGIVVDPFLLEYLTEHAGYCTVVLKDAPDPAVARRALEAARAALAAVRAGGRDGDPVVTWTSGVASTPDGFQFSFDAGDAAGHDGLIEHLLDTVVSTLGDAGLAVALLTHPPTPGLLLETATAPSPDADHAGASPAGWPLDIPLPDPRQEIYGAASPDACSRAFMVPHPAEELMAFFEKALPRQGYAIIISVDLVQPGSTYVGRVFFRQGDLTGQVAVTHAGSARHVEISLKTGPGEIQAMLANLGAQEQLPPGMRLRVDNRHGTA